MGMMYFQVEEDKVEKVSEHLEKGLRYIGKAKQCVDELMQEGGAMNERVNYRDNADYRGDDMDYRQDGGMGYRQGVRGTGSYRMNRRNVGYPMYREPYMM